MTITRPNYADFVYQYNFTRGFAATIIGTGTSVRDYNGNPLITSADDFEIGREIKSIQLTVTE